MGCDEAEFASSELGRYFAHTALLDLNFERRDIERTLKRFGKRVKGTQAVAIARSGRFDLDAIKPLLTHQHERTHHVTVLSTPAGLLLWRLFTQVTSTTEFVLRKLRASSIAESVRVPLREWYQRAGPDVLATAVFTDPAGGPAHGSTAGAAGVLGTIVAAKFSEIDALLAFESAFNGNAKSLTMRGFVDAANRASTILRERYNLDLVPCVWTASDIEAKHYLPEPAFTLAEIVEAEARFAELQILLAVGTEAAVVDEWRKKHVTGVYKRAFSWLMDQLGDIVAARCAILISLCGPVDPAGAAAVGGRIVVEDALPGWRLIKAVESLRNQFWPASRTERAILCADDVARRAGISAPRTVLRALLDGSLSDPEAYSADARLYRVADPAASSVYMRFIESRFRAYLRRAEADPMEICEPASANSDKPLLEFYRDGLVPNIPAGVDRPSTLLAGAFIDMIRNIALLGVLDGNNLGRLVHFVARLNEFEAPESQGGGRSKDAKPATHVDLPAMLSAIMGPAPAASVSLRD